ELAVDRVPEVAVALVAAARVEEQPSGQLALEPGVDAQAGPGAIDLVGRLEAGEALRPRLLCPPCRGRVIIDPLPGPPVAELPRCRIPRLDAVILEPELRPGHERHRLEPCDRQRPHQ